MIEPIMYFGIGFLVAALIGLVIVPLVHGRAVRLTMRRLEAATPLSIAEIQADKDQLRAEFAMSTRRLEMSVDQLKGRTTSQLAEIGKKGDAINQLKIEIGEKTATIFALEARDKTLRDQLRTTEEEVEAKNSAKLDVERALADKESELAKRESELDERSMEAEAQKVEIVALKTQIEALKERLNDAANEVKAVEDRRDAARAELKTATQQLAEERGRVENLGRRISELEQQLAAQAAEAQLLARRSQDLENRLGDQSRLLAQSEFEFRQLQGELEEARKTESDLRTVIADISDRAGLVTQQVKAENAELRIDLDRANNERDRLARELASVKRETEENWASERVENSLLRERINDVAAEVARLASALEGPNSPIDAILAAKTERVHETVGAVAARGGPERAEAPANGGLADRIRALQTRASRLPQGEKPNRRN
jgi:chromosome segregation ATPase